LIVKDPGVDQSDHSDSDLLRGKCADQIASMMKLGPSKEKKQIY
jgi:hypothetical protein